MEQEGSPKTEAACEAGDVQAVAVTQSPRDEAVTVTEVTATPVVEAWDAWWVKVVHVLVLALVACVAVFNGFRRGYTLAPTDALQLVAPWSTDEKYVARNEQLLDQTVQFVPWTIYAKQRLAAGQIPLWNPHSQLGAPLVGNGQSAVFYPTMLLHLYLPETWSWTISAALRLFAAGVGMWALAGHYGLRGGPRLLAGVAFMLCGFNVVWLNHPQMNVMPLLPWAIFLVEKLLVRVTLPRFILASVVFAVQFLGGHPATTIHLLLACGLVVGLRLVFESEPGVYSRRAKWVGRAGAVLASVVFGFALAAVQWLPLVEYARNSGAQLVRGEKLADAPFFAVDPRPLIGVVFPYANGYPPDGITPFEMRQATRLPNTNELSPGWIGTIPLVLAVIGMVVAVRRRGTALMYLIVAAVMAAIAIKMPLINYGISRVPGLNVSQNTRLLGVTAFALALLSGFGLEALLARLRGNEDAVRLRKTLAWTAGGVAVLALLGTLVLLVARSPIINRGIAKAKARYDADPVHEHTWPYVEHLVRRVHTELTLTSLRLLIPAAMLGAAAYLLSRHRRGQGKLTLAARAWPWLGLAVVDLLAFGAFYNPGAPAQTYFPSAPTIDRLEQLPKHRLAATFRTLIPESSTAMGLDDVRGYDALAPRRYYQWWAHEGIGDLPGYMQGYLSRFDKPAHPAWALLNLGYLVTAPGHPAPPANLWQPIHTGEDANIYQANTVRPRAWVVPRAEVHDTADQVLDRVAKMDFNPDEVVLLDRELAWDAKYMPGAEQLAESNFWQHGSPSRAAGRQATVQFLPAPPKEGVQPEVIRLQVTGAYAGGWLVLADSYFPGWTASVVTERYGHEAAIVPAYGVLRAIQLPAGASSIRVEFRYRPWSWRIGAMTSASAAAVLLILIGLAMFSPGRVGSAHHPRATPAPNDLP